MKRCTRCGEEKPLDDFPRRNATKLHSRCKPCHAAANKEHWYGGYSERQKQKRREHQQHVERVDMEAWRNVMVRLKKEKGLSWPALEELCGVPPWRLRNMFQDRHRRPPTKEEAEMILRRVMGLPAPLSEYQQKKLKEGQENVYLPDGTCYVRPG